MEIQTFSPDMSLPHAGVKNPTFSIIQTIEKSYGRVRKSSYFLDKFGPEIQALGEFDLENPVIFSPLLNV